MALITLLELKYFMTIYMHILQTEITKNNILWTCNSYYFAIEVTKKKAYKIQPSMLSFKTSKSKNYP
jgi:hypothetical protein